MDKKRLLMLVEIAIFAAIGFVLDQVSIQIGANGGSVSLVMVPIVLIAFRWGLSAGLTTGLILGVMQAMFGGYIVHWFQAILDYGVAFTLVGLAAVVRKPVLAAAEKLDKKKMTIYIVLGTVLGGLLRYLSHSLAGIVFFAPVGKNPYLFSLVYNGTYMIPATIITAVACVLLFTAAPQLMQRKS